MSQLNNPMTILKLLDKSNCGECGYATCLAFAGAVFKGQKQLNLCSHLDSDVINRFEEETQDLPNLEPDLENPLEELKRRLTNIDLPSSAQRLGAKFKNDKLTIKVCGKDFSIDSKGNFYSEIHIHDWITIPVLNYVIDGGVRPVSGEWVSFRELKNGMDWYRFFVHKCEKPLKRVADTYTELFQDMLHIFNGKKVVNQYESDISLVLHPLPRLPILICYWKPEDGLESSLNIFFDTTASYNLNIESIYSLGTGLTTMFEKISLRHGFKELS